MIARTPSSAFKRHRLLAAFATVVLVLLVTVPAAGEDADEPWLKERLEWLQDLKFGFMMHWAPDDHRDSRIGYSIAALPSRVRLPL